VFDRSGVKGAIRVSADGGVVVSSRTYNLLLAGNQWNLPEGATFGQNVPGVTPAEGLSAGEEGVIPGVVRNASYRSNVVLLNMSGAAVTVEADVVSMTGDMLGGPVTMTLQPYEYGQIGDVVGAAGISGDLERGTLAVRVVAGQGPVNVLLSVADNRTGDPVTRMAQK
jgi:hypothetical protein